MGIQNSNLAQPGYGYDTVVAVTQKALNNAIETYYEDAKTFSPVTFYFIKNGSGNPVAVDKTTLLANYTSGIDPLAATVTPAQQKTLSASQFYFAFSFKIGNPQNYLGTNYITLKPASNSVRYYLLCFQLQVAFWNPDNKTWVDIKQTTAKEFNIYADINLKNVLDNTNLPASVQAAVNTLGGTGLNIQQLIFDLDTAVVDPTSKLTQLDNTCSVFEPLMQQFSIAYFSTYTAQSGALNYAITTPNSASLIPTKMDWFIGAFVGGEGEVVTNPTQDQQDLAAVNYIFSNNGDSLNTGNQFYWNWLDDNGSVTLPPDMPDVNKYDGAIAIKRDAFAKYLVGILTPYVQQNCWKPIVGVNMPEDDNSEYYLSFNLGTLASYDGFQPYSYDSFPDILASYVFNSTANVNNGWFGGDHLNVSFFFSLTASADSASELSIEQTIKWTVDLVGQNGATIVKGNAIYRIYKDVFNISIGDTGGISFTKAENPNSEQDLSDKLAVNSAVIEGYDYLAQQLTVENFKEITAVLPSQFVFPGANAFVFEDAQFSNYSDIVCHFTYKAES